MSQDIDAQIEKWTHYVEEVQAERAVAAKQMQEFMDFAQQCGKNTDFEDISYENLDVQTRTQLSEEYGIKPVDMTPVAAKPSMSLWLQKTRAIRV